MGATSDKVSGLANQAAGKVKQGLGRATGNDNLEAEGLGQEVRGKTQKAVGDAKSVVKNVADQFKKSVDRA